MNQPTDPSPAISFLDACVARPAVAQLGLLLALTGLPANSAEPAQRWESFRGDPQLTGKSTGELAENLRPVWTLRDEDGFEATAAIADGRVFVGSMGGRFRAVDLDTGKEVWRFDGEWEIKSSALIATDTVFFGDEEGMLRALASSTGEERWTFAADGGITSSPNQAGPCLLFGSYDNYLYCLDPTSGAERWKLETEGYINATPAVWQGHAISAGCDGYLRIVRLSDGVEVRNIELGGYVGASACIIGQRAFVGNFENQVLGIDLQNGVVQWVYDPADRDFPFYSSAAADERIVVIGGRDKRVHALAPETGESLWTFTANARIDASPVLVGQRVFTATQSGELLALNLDDGSVVWRFETGEGMSASPAVADGRLVIGTIDGTLFAFGPGLESD